MHGMDRDINQQDAAGQLTCLPRYSIYDTLMELAHYLGASTQAPFWTM